MQDQFFNIIHLEFVAALLCIKTVMLYFTLDIHYPGERHNNTFLAYGYIFTKLWWLKVYYVTMYDTMKKIGCQNHGFFLL